MSVIFFCMINDLKYFWFKATYPIKRGKFRLRPWKHFFMLLWAYIKFIHVRDYYRIIGLKLQ